MNKKFILALTAFLTLSTVCMANNLEPLDFSNNSSNSSNDQKQSASGYGSSLDTTTKYYPNASLSSAISKYRKANYAGCLQELFSYVQKKPEDAVAYYYMGMAFTKIGDSDAAVKSYERVIAISKDPALTQFAQQGKDNLTGGTETKTETKTAEKAQPVKTPEQLQKEKEESLEDFVNSPYGNGLSPELNQQIKEEKLKRIQETINKKDKLENKDLEKIRKFDLENSSSNAETVDRIASANPSDKDILNAIKTLKDAGMNVSVQATPSTKTETSDSTAQNQQYINPVAMMTGGYTDPQMAQMSMMLGNNNNNNNMMNMMPFLMQSQQNGQNIDPQVMQAIIMQQMMPDFGVNNNNN